MLFADGQVEPTSKLQLDVSSQHLIVDEKDEENQKEILLDPDKLDVDNGKRPRREPMWMPLLKLREMPEFQRDRIFNFSMKRPKTGSMKSPYGERLFSDKHFV